MFIEDHMAAGLRGDSGGKDASKETSDKMVVIAQVRINGSSDLTESCGW